MSSSTSSKVVAHAKLIQSQHNTFIIETVVTRKDKRGSGYGRRVMEELYNYAKTHLPQGSILYLSTKITTFYEKCGFERCEAPESFGKVCSSLNTQQIHSLSNMLAKRFQQPPPTCSNSSSTSSSEIPLPTSDPSRMTIKDTTTSDAEMKDVTSSTTSETTTPANPQEELELVIRGELKDQLKMIAKSVQQDDLDNDRKQMRAFRLFYNKLRRQITDKILVGILKELKCAHLVSYIEETIEMQDEEQKPIPEAEVYLWLITIIFLTDKKQYNRAYACAYDCIKYQHVLEKQQRSRSMNFLFSKVYFYFSFIHEKLHTVSNNEFRNILLGRLRSCTLAHDHWSQFVILNCLLRSYLQDKLVEQANKLLKTVSIDQTIGHVDNNQLARYYYYKGRIQAIQLDYSEAYNSLQTALRKAPSAQPNKPKTQKEGTEQSNLSKRNVGRGFRIHANKLLIVVSLLMGHIPDRSLFVNTLEATNDNVTLAQLKPYYELTQQVRLGNVNGFETIVEKYRDQYIADDNLTLINRIRQNVIRTGLKSIIKAYSRISFADVSKKLNLTDTDVNDVQGIVAKAIKDGIIDAKIDEQAQSVDTAKNQDVYQTSEPAEEFDKRIQFCLSCRSQCIKAMRYREEKKKKPTVDQDESLHLDVDEIVDEVDDDIMED
nr:unnamed protein product [Naegleria fowleri]